MEVSYLMKVTSIMNCTADELVMAGLLLLLKHLVVDLQCMIGKSVS